MIMFSALKIRLMGTTEYDICSSSGFILTRRIVFLDADLRRAVAYHWNTSKFQDLGNICPGDYGMIGEIETSFIYTPCWMDGGFPVEQKKSTTAN